MDMEFSGATCFFLGANSRYGFYSLYDELADTDGCTTLYILKGGPGCGKSSFMKTIGSAMAMLGFSAEYIFCSGDPGSLDGIYFPGLNTAYVDGTAPHVREPVYPGACEMYIDLGSFYDHERLHERKADIMKTNSAYKGFYKRAYSLLSAAGALTDNITETMLTPRLRSGIEARALGIAAREFPKPSGHPGKLRRRFVSAVTCQGDIFLEDTVNSLAERKYVIDNSLGFSHVMLDTLAREAVRSGLYAVACPSHMDPKITAHLIIPELSMAFISRGKHREEYGFKPYRHLRLDAMADPAALRSVRPVLRNAAKMQGGVMTEARSALRSAGILHDSLEEIYNPCVDFGGVYDLASRHIKMLTAK